MRRYITLIENLQQANFETFEREWGEYVLTVDDTIDESEMEQLYLDYLPEVSELGRVPLYRGLNVSEKWVDDLLSDRVSHVGVHWSKDLDVASTFSKTSSNYDSRFADQSKGRHVILQARDIDLSSIDVNGTIACMMAANEQEVRFFFSRPIFIASVLIDGQWHLIGKTLLT